MQTANTKVGVVSLVLAGVNVIGVLGCLAWFLFLRHLFILDYKELGGEVPPDLLRGIQTPMFVWILGTVATVAVFVAKERLRRKWIPLLVNLATIPILVVLAGVISVEMFAAQCYVGSGTWEDDAKNWYRAFNEQQPTNVTVIHSKYWNSAHWTTEYMYFFEVEAGAEWRSEFLKRRAVEPVPASKAAVFRDNTHWDITPAWFVPGTVDRYEVWDRPGYAGSVWMDKTNGHLFFEGAQL